ncbi:MAG: hypothetical protein KatS3mg126_1602 [Lysobacteraceae bacterium]|nr:MAG: hypothetical protein KatS3mg126_1602 [Xanthomonadaceae bacterium]
MTSTLAVLLDLCLLRRGPWDLASSPRLARDLVLIGLGADLLYVTLLDVPDGVPRVGLGLVLLLVIPSALLRWRGRSPRYPQTLAALAGTGALFSLLFLLPGLWMDAHPVQPGVAPASTQVLAGWAFLSLLCWRLLVIGRILGQALDLPRVAGLGLALAWFLLELQLDRWLFGVPA